MYVYIYTYIEKKQGKIEETHGKLEEINGKLKKTNEKMKKTIDIFICICIDIFSMEMQFPAQKCCK